MVEQVADDAARQALNRSKQNESEPEKVIQKDINITLDKMSAQD